MPNPKINLGSIARLLLTISVFAVPVSSRGQWKLVAPNLISSGSVSGAMCYRDGVAWVSRNSLWSSKDSGATWTKLSGPPLVFDLQFHDRLNGIAANYSGVYVTSDGGTVWQLIHNGGATSACFGSTTQIIAIADRDVGVLTSRDGGLNWTSANSPGFAFYVTSLPDGTLEYFAGTTFGGALGKSTDAGRTWSKSKTSVDWDSFTFAVDSCDDSRVYLANEDAVAPTDQLSQIFVTSDWGTSWATHDPHPLNFFSGSVALGRSTAYCPTVLSGIYRSTDRGASWAVMPGSPSSGYDTRLVCAISDNIVLAADDNGSIWRTVNSGGDSIRTPASRGEAALPQHLIYPDSLLPCMSEAATVHVVSGLCGSLSSILTVRIVGPDSLYFTFQYGGNSDSVVVSFNPTAGRGYIATLELQLKSGAVVTVPLAGVGKSAPYLTLSAHDVSNDTIGALVYVPIVFRDDGSQDTINLSLHFDTSVLLYRGTYLGEGESSDQTTAVGAGFARLLLHTAHVTSSDSIIGYAEFQVFPKSLPCTTLLFDSISITTEHLTCTTTNPSFTAQICSKVGCGTPTLSDYLRYDKFPDLALSPNPATGIVTLRSDADLGMVEIEICDLVGQLQCSTSAELSPTDQIEINTASLPSGIYSVRVATLGFRTSLKLLVIK